MKKQLLTLLLMIVCLTFSCKKEDKVPEFNIVGKEYAARWKVNSNNRQEYVHIIFNENGKITLFTSIEKLLKYGDEKLPYTKSGDNYNINGILKESHYLPVGTVIDWNITPTKDPTYEGSTIKSTFQIGDLNFIDQRP